MYHLIDFTEFSGTNVLFVKMNLPAGQSMHVVKIRPNTTDHKKSNFKNNLL